MKYLSLSIPGIGQIDSGLPNGVPTGGLFTTGPSIIQALFALVVIAAVLYAFWQIGRAGIDMIMSEGIKEKVKIGHERLFHAVFGLIMLFVSFLLINIISVFFDIKFPLLFR